MQVLLAASGTLDVRPLSDAATDVVSACSRVDVRLVASKGVDVTPLLAEPAL